MHCRRSCATMCIQRRGYIMLLGPLTTVIWDFNGTLIDDLDLVVRSVNAQLAKRGLPALSAEAYRDVFRFPVQDYYRAIGVTFENESMADLSADFFAGYAPALKDCPLHIGVAQTLKAFEAQGTRQFVLSAMEQGMLRSMIGHLGIESHFSGIYGLAHQEGDSKVARGRELLHDFRIEPTTALLIGDTDHDAEVAAALGVSAVLIGLGHQSEERLRVTGRPVYTSYHDLRRALLPEAA
jgi:phosphoglycolate phosphatase